MSEWRGEIVWLRKVDEFCVWLHFSMLNSRFSISREPWWGGESIDRQASPQDTRERFTVSYTCWGNGFQKNKRGKEKKKPYGNGWELVVFVSSSVRENSQNPVYKSKSLHTGFFFLFFWELSLGWLLTTFSTSSEWMFCASSVLHVLLWRRWQVFLASFLLVFHPLSFSGCPCGARQVSVFSHAFHLLVCFQWLFLNSRSTSPNSAPSQRKLYLGKL